MKPDVTFLTSTELQRVLGNELDEDEMDALQRFRDRVVDRFRSMDGALETMEQLYGREWRTLDVQVWVFDAPRDSISSPILLRKEDEDETVFTAFQMLAKELIRGDPPESGLVAKGYDRIDAVSALLASAGLAETLDAATHGDLMGDVRRDADETKLWRTVDEFDDQWGRDRPLYDWMEQR